MIGLAFKTLVKVLLALAAVFGVVALLQYYDSQQSDYIEIYNDDEWEGDSY